MTDHPNARAQNYTIDDSQWATPALQLSGGWNMLRINGSDEYISQPQVDVMRPHLGEFWNSSVSWTTTDGSWTSISFVGTRLWAYGVAGPNQGSFEATLNNETVGTYSANLAFDYAVIESLAKWNKTTPNSDNSSSAVSPTSTPTTSSVVAAAAEGTASATDESDAAAAAALMPTDYSPAQLAFLSTPYTFKWNGWSYFVVIFGAIVFSTFFLFAAHMLIRRWVRSRPEVAPDAMPPKSVKVVGKAKKGSSKGKEKEVEDGESYLVQPGRRARRTTRLLEVLRGKKISPPIASDNGSITTGESGWNRSEVQVSYGTADNLDGAERGGEPRANLY
ncbi:hypothetical protein IAT38_005212 [Cryptococcus sp. DSM 104549]